METPMSEAQVVQLMESATSEADWHAKCDQVRRACGGQYPAFWYAAIVQSGLTRRVAARWGSDDQIRVSSL
jgi:hypothetical protein